MRHQTKPSLISATSMSTVSAVSHVSAASSCYAHHDTLSNVDHTHHNKTDSPSTNFFAMHTDHEQQLPSPINSMANNSNQMKTPSEFAHVKVSEYFDLPGAAHELHDDEDTEYNEMEDSNALFAELFLECCWKEKLGVLYDKVKSIYGTQIANSINFAEKATVFFACDIYNDPLICFFREKSQLIASYRLTCKNLDDTFSGKCGVGVTDALAQTGGTSLNIELLFIWCGIRDVKPIRSLRSLTHCDDDDYHYYQFYSVHNYNNTIHKTDQNVNGNNHRNANSKENKTEDVNSAGTNDQSSGNMHYYDGNDDFESLFNSNETPSHSLLHQMHEMSAFDYDLLVLNDFTKTLSVYSANYKLCDIVLPQFLNISMIQSLNHAVNNRVTLQYGESEQYRIVIPRWDKNIRVIAVLKCFQLFLSPDLMHCIRVLLIELHNANNGKLWDELCHIILYLISDTTNPQKPDSRPAHKQKPSKNKTAWQRLQESDFHQQICQQQETILAKLPMTSKQDNSDYLHSEDISDKSDGFIEAHIKHKLHAILAKFSKLCVEESNDKSKWDAPNEFIDIQRIASSIDESTRFDMLISVHLLYENCKLSMLLKSHLEPLALLLSKISLQIGMYSYFDCYCRDYGYQILGKLMKYPVSQRLLSTTGHIYNDKNVCPVPSIYEIILQCMRGNRKLLDEFPFPSASLLFDLSSQLSPKYVSSKKRNHKFRTKPNNESSTLPQNEAADALKSSQFHTGSAIFSPLLAPYSLLRKVCYFYDILTAQPMAPQPNNNKLFATTCTPRNMSRYCLKNQDVFSTPLQTQTKKRSSSTYMNRINNSFITPYTPSSIKKTRTRSRIMSPSTPFVRNTSSRIKSDSKLGMDSFGAPLTAGYFKRHNLSMHNTKINEPYPFFSPSFLIKEETVYAATNRAQQLVLAMVEENFTLNDLDCLPLGIALPLREALRSCRYSPPHNWPNNAYVLIGREDLINKGVIADSDEEHESDRDDKKCMDLQEDDEEEQKADASPLGMHSVRSTNSVTFVAKDKYKFEFGLHANQKRRGYSGKRYQVKKLLQEIGPPKPRLHAVNDINAIHKSCNNIRSAAKTLKSLFMTDSNFLASSMVKSTRQRLMNEIGGDINAAHINSFVDEQLMCKQDPDGTLTVLDECLLRFGGDYRVKEVRRILRSDKARRIRDIIGDGRIFGDQDLGRDINAVPEYHINLFHLVKRRVAQCVGRGMFTIWSYCPTATKPIDIPLLNMAGAVPNRNLNLQLDFAIIESTVKAYLNNNNQHLDAADIPHYLSSFDDVIFQEYEDVDNELFLQWADFHNGCSAGLRVLSNYDESPENIRTWISYNRPRMPSYSHAGFIFAQGLNGHLTNLMPADFYWYLGHKHEPTTMAIILGLSIARRSTMDTYVHKMCCLHIASMVPGGFNELGIETTVQASALLGCGFLFLGTKHKLSTDMLLVEIVRRCSSSSSFYGGSARNGGGYHNASSSLNNHNFEDRECYSLCAGIALGLIHLGCGGETTLNLENRLEQLMGGTPQRCKMLHYLYDIFNARTSVSANYTGASQPVSRYGVNTGIPGGAGANSQSTVTGLSVFATSNIINPSIVAHDHHSKQQKQQQSHANPDNFDVEELVSGKNHLRAAIHYFMPNFSDFPDINDDYNNNDDELNGNSRIRDGQWVNTDMTAPGAILAFGLMYLKTNNKSAAKRLIIPTKPYLLDHIQPEWVYLKVLCKCIILWDSIHCNPSYFMRQIPKFIDRNFPYKHIIKPLVDRNHKKSSKEEKDDDDDEEEEEDDEKHLFNEENMDYHAITLCYINIVSATCFAIALKYAGTHHKAAGQAVHHYLLQFLKCRNILKSGYGVSQLNLDRYTIETTLGIIAISLAIIMCGSGDLETFRIFRELRQCIDSEITYGHHQMYSMCIGFLFLGGGKLTFGTSKIAIAALLIACYPRFPIHTLDNQFHLQILRHLYVLAIEKRHITTIDIDTNLPVKVPITVTVKSENGKKEISKQYTTPCLLPDYHKICNLKIACSEFWDIEFNHLQTNVCGWKSIISQSGIIYLKRKSGYIRKKNKGFIDTDTQYQYNNIVNVLNNNSKPQRHVLFDNHKKKQADLVKAFGADPNILEFAKQFCSPYSRMGKFCGYALYECLSNAKSEMIQTYIQLYHAMSHSVSSSYTNRDIVQDIKLLNTYYQYQYGKDWNMQQTENERQIEPLIQFEFIATLKNKFETLYRSLFLHNKMGQNLLLRYVKCGWNVLDMDAQYSSKEMVKCVQTLGAFLSYSEIDNSFIIHNALKSLRQSVGVSTKNVDYVLRHEHASQQQRQPRKLVLWPLLNIAIQSELQKIHSVFGYYGGVTNANNNNNQARAPRTPSISSLAMFGETPARNVSRNNQNHNRVAFETPKHQSKAHGRNQTETNHSTCLPKSFGLSVLTNLLNQ